MFDLILEVISQLQNEATTYPQGVLNWMKFMAISFLLSLVFVYSKSGARWILTAFVLNILGLICGKMLFPDLTRSEIGTYVHLTVWSIILWQIWKPSHRPSFAWSGIGVYNSVYLVWLTWASALMFISLILDFRFFVELVLAKVS